MVVWIFVCFPMKCVLNYATCMWMLRSVCIHIAYAKMWGGGGGGVGEEGM